MREAFEEPEPDSLIADAAMQAASIWMIYDADVLWAKVRDEASFEGRSASAGRKLAEKNWTGYNEVRWKHRQEGFGKVEELQVGSDTKQMAKNPRQHMMDAEREVKA